LVFLQKFSIQVEPGYEGIALGMRYNPATLEERCRLRSLMKRGLGKSEIEGLTVQ
jgi:hypothetical protein